MAEALTDCPHGCEDCEPDSHEPERICELCLRDIFRPKPTKFYRMTNERHAELHRSVIEGTDVRLTDDEMLDGWHWCDDFDGLLVGPDTPEADSCVCNSLCKSIHEVIQIIKANRDEGPVRLCCGERHAGPQCPDGKVMCCLCFERFDVDELATNNQGEKTDVCIQCDELDRRAAQEKRHA